MIEEDEQRTLAEFQQFRSTNDPVLRNRLVDRHQWVAKHAARRFANRGEALDDLIQVASIGVVKAVDRFDPEIGTSFPSYAMATAIGELRRHFRDATWAVRVPRRIKELHLELSGVIDSLTHELGRSPRVRELAEHLKVSEDQVLEAMEAGAGYRPVSLATPGAADGDRRGVAEARLASDDSDLISVADRLTVEALMDALPDRERQIVRMRFFDGLTQSEIAEVVGVSQVHVSRLLRASLQEMRRRFDRGAPRAGSAKVPGEG